MITNIPAYKFNWPRITVEGYKENLQKVIMVFNFDITSPGKVKHVLQYVVGRTVWCSLNLPADVNILLSFDFRGQSIIATKAEMFKSELMALLTKANVSNQISIDLLI